MDMGTDGIEIHQVRRNTYPRTIFIVLLILIAIVFGLWLFNYLTIERPLQQVLNSDSRNKAVSAQAHIEDWIFMDTLVFDLTNVSGKASRIDVFRCFLQYAKAMRDRHFGEVLLAARGRNKFKMDGTYFQQLGQEYDSQNPIYTIRTFPTHLTAMDGTKPFPEYDGGILGVVLKQLEQFTEFSNQWYGNDFGVTALPGATSNAAAKPDAIPAPCDSVSGSDSGCETKTHWVDSGISVNAIDGTKTEFLSIQSADPDGVDFGQVHYAELVVCFENGRLCGGKRVGVAVSVHGMIDPLGYETGEEYSTSVRLRFDSGKPLRQTWGISDDHEGLFPFGHEEWFLKQLLNHTRFILEFSYYEKPPRTVSFDVSGLSEVMKTHNLQDR